MEIVKRTEKNILENWCQGINSHQNDISNDNFFSSFRLLVRQNITTFLFTYPNATIHFETINRTKNKSQHGGHHAMTGEVRPLA